MDLELLRAISSHRTKFLDGLTRGLMHLGTSIAVLEVALVLALAVVVAVRAWRAAGAVVVAVVVASVLAALLKQVIGRARPPSSLALVHANGLSMPSTDAARTAAAATALFVAIHWAAPRLRQVAAVLLAALTALVGFALVYLGAHWVSDVLAGWALGVAVGAGAGALVRSDPPESVGERRAQPV